MLAEIKLNINRLLKNRYDESYTGFFAAYLKMRVAREGKDFIIVRMLLAA